MNRASVEQLMMVVQAHPGLILEGEERETFGAEVPDLAAIEREHAADSEAMVYCAWAYRKLGRFDEALAAGDRAIAAERSFASLSAKASVYRAMGDADSAVRLFGEAAELDPDDTSAFKEAARTLGEVGRFNDAVEWFNRALERDDCDAEAEMWREYSAFCATRDPKHVDHMRKLADLGYQLAKRLLADMGG